MPAKISIAYQSSQQLSATQQPLDQWAEQLQLPLVPLEEVTTPYYLLQTESRLELHPLDKSIGGAIYVDFVEGASAHRRLHGGGKGQLIAKAVGLKKLDKPAVLDVTAGLGRDAFVLACLGCDVTMIERSPIIAALLQDGLQRAEKHDWFVDLKLQLVVGDAIEHVSGLKASSFPDVIYCDPMFPERTKSALVKKEMRMLRDVVGDDVDAVELLSCAIKHVKNRVVVKRPRLSDVIGDTEPSFQLKGKSSRYDVYQPSQ